MSAPLEIQVLGDFAVMRGGKQIPLPPSRKTRALLAYLAFVDRPQNRERLCEMFWDVPDDPRGSLRWSLSKLRPIVNDGAREPLQADRLSVRFRAGEGIAVDYRRFKELSADGLAALSVEELEETARLFRGPFLADLSLPRCPIFEAWRVAVAGEIDVARCRALRALIDRLRHDPARALPHAVALHSLNPDDPALGEELKQFVGAAREQATHAGREAVSVDVPSQAAGRIAVTPTTAQDIRFCKTADGARIAYAVTGEGMPIVKAANWMSHLHYDWESPIWRHWIDGLSERNRLIRYDERGNGLSDWDVDDLSFDAMLADLEAVVDAAGVDRFALLGLSQGCAISVAYAVRHPHRVSHLVLYGGYVKGWRARGNPEEIARRAAMSTLMREGWGQDNPAFRQMFATLFIPGATKEHMSWFNELQRKTVSPDNAAQLHDSFGNIDVTGLLGRVTAPTLVLHARGDAVVPFDQCRAYATGIRGARFVTLDSGNHIMLDHEPAFGRFLVEVRDFLSKGPARR